jgi:hypothetical protein
MADISADYSQDFLDCRDMLHAWDASSTTITQPDKDHLARQLTCLRCGTIKHQLLDIKSFELVSTRYEVPLGYRLPRDVHKTDIRKANIGRQLRTHKTAKRVTKR